MLLRTLILLALVSLGACQATGPQASARRTPGDLHYVGSSTVGVFVGNAEPVYGAVRFDLDTEPESAGGERAIVAGEADLAGIARAPEQTTLDAGVIATLIGRDAIAVIVNLKNPVRELSRAELRSIFTGEVRNWHELGGPDLAIEPYIVGPGSATRAVFAEAVLAGAEYAGCQEAVPDSAMLEAVAGSPGAIGQLSFSFLGPRSGVRPVGVDGAFPSVTNFAYPIARPLYLLWRAGDPVVEEFVAWSRSHEGQGVLMRNFVGNGVLGSVRSNREPDPTGTLVVHTPTYRFNDGGIQYRPHGPYKILDRFGKFVRTVRNHRGENDETPERIELPPGTYLIRTPRPPAAPAEFFVTIDAGKLTELDVVGLLDPLGPLEPGSRPRTPPPAWPGRLARLKFYGDARLRAEGTFDRNGADDDARLRLRMRLGVNYRVNEEVLVGVRASTGDRDDPNSQHVTLGDAFDGLEVSLDRAFVSYRPLALEGAWGELGKFNHAFHRNPVYGELLWDADVQPEGILFGRSWRDASYRERLSLTVGSYSVVHQSDGEDVFALVAQASGAADLSDDVSARLSLAGYYYTDANPKGSTTLIDDNTSNAAQGGKFVSEFGILNPVLALECRAADQPLVLSLEYMKNLRAEIHGDEGWAAGVALGSESRAGDWRSYYQWQVIERDAVFSPFAQDDFVARTNFRGHVVGVRHLLTDKVSLHLWGLFQSLEQRDAWSTPGDENHDPWRVRVDLDIKF